MEIRLRERSARSLPLLLLLAGSCLLCTTRARGAAPQAVDRGAPDGAPHAQQRQGPVAPITAGWGRWGRHTMATPESFEIESQGLPNRVTLYFPEGQTRPAPTLFFAPGWEISAESYMELLGFLVSKGYVVVFDDYVEDSGAIGTQLCDSFRAAAVRYPERIDTTRIGLVGHSSGAGLLPSVGYRLAVESGWGASGRFIFSSAPWIDFDLTEEMLAAYPGDMKLIIQTYEEDLSTDLRTYIDQFESLARIPDSEKEYITLRPCTVEGYEYHADHATIAGGGNGYGVYDALDDYGVFRLLDALADYTFGGDRAAGGVALGWRSGEGRRISASEIALGDGGDPQISMGGQLRDLISSDDPRPIPGAVYDYPCDIDENPRRDHCDDYDGELPAAVLLQPIKHLDVGDNPPLFSWESVVSADRYDLQVRPLLENGEPDWGISYGEEVSATEAGCEESGDCGYWLDSLLPEGPYVWWVKAYGDEIEGVWSRRGYFQRIPGGD
jgi:hypothetical protein